MTKGLGFRSAIFAAVTMTGACTVHQADVPPLMGPSDLALSISIAATPDSISHDGASQSSIVVTARDAQGAAVAGQPFRLDIITSEGPADYGTLSGKTIVTGSDGRATAVYTAPPAPGPGQSVGTCAGAPFGPITAGTCIQIAATAIGSNFQAASGQAVTLRLVPVGIILPPAQTPIANLVITPASAFPGQTVLFDGSSSCPTPDPCSSPDGIVSYQWSFGDGDFASGATVTHDYDAAGTYTVTLTVTNDRGRAASKSATISIGQSAPPTGTIVVSPEDVSVGQTVFITVTNVTPGNGRTVVSYDWNFGDGTTASGQSVTKSWAAANTYTIVLTITDDLGQTRNISRTITVDP
jgi:PKD repeat protein